MDVAVTKKIEKTDQALTKGVRKGDKEALETLFYRYHAELCAIAAKVTDSSDYARDIVQDVFLRIWKTRQTWQVNQSVKAYLYQAVWNEALNAKKKNKNQRELSEEYTRHANLIDSQSENHRDTDKLIEDIWNAVDDMPQRRRFVFTLHRKHGLTHKEIAEVMQITRKTVENHMGLALKEIRELVS